MFHCDPLFFCRRLLCAAVSLATTLLLAFNPAAAQQDVVSGSITVTRLTMGFNGSGRVGNWLPVRVTATGASPSSEFTLVITASDPGGNQCESVVAESTSDGQGTLELEGVFVTGRLDAPIRLRLDDPTGKTVWRHTVACKAKNLKQEPVEGADAGAPAPVISGMTLHRHHPMTLLTAGTPAGLPELVQRLAVSPATKESLTLFSVDSLQDLPDSGRGLDSVDTLLLVTEYGLTEAQTQAIRDWVLTGGRLIVSCGKNLPQLLESPIAAWLVPEFGIERDLLQSQDLSALQNYVSGASQLQTNRYEVPIVRMSSEGPRVVVNSINGPLITRVSVGAGVITMVAVDVNLKPLNQWLSLSHFYELLLFDRLLDISDEQLGRGGRISSSGVSDLATQLASVSDAIPASERWSSWQAMLLMLVYLLIIGPLDYLFVVRLLRRPRLTWITFPVLVATACGLAFWWSNSHRAAATVREVHLLDVAQAGDYQMMRTRTWSSLSTTNSRYASVTAKALPVTSERPLNGSEQSMVWHGRAEDVYGGLYRESGAGLGQQTSRRTEIGDVGFTSIPLMVDSSQAFLSEVRYNAGEFPAFESNLTMPSSGLLEGTFRHFLPSAIHDWVIVFGNRVYIPSPKADDKFRRVEPNEPWSRSEGVRVSEIRDFLRGIRIISREKQKGDTSTRSTQIQSVYNISGTNPHDILLMISLYHTAGGDAYIRLQDDFLRRDEISDAIQLNTAMLIGTVDLPLTQLQLDNEGIEPVETQTVVRLFLPVTRTAGTGVIQEADPKAKVP